MNEQEIKAAVEHMTREQLIELVVTLTIIGREKREKLDKIRGIIR